MKKGRGVCGFCLTGQCCEGVREYDSFICSHAQRCEPHEGEEDMADQTQISPLLRCTQRGWAQIDSEVDAIMAAAPGDLDQALLKASARGKAEILAELMRHGCPRAWAGATADDVSAEAGRRAQYRNEGRRYGTLGVETSTRHLTDTEEGWTLMDNKRGVLETSGAA